MLAHKSTTNPVSPAASAVHHGWETETQQQPSGHTAQGQDHTPPHRNNEQQFQPHCHPNLTQHIGTSRGAQPRTFHGRDGPLHVPIAGHAPRRDPPLRPPTTAPRRDPTAARDEAPAPAPGGGGERAEGGGELQRRRGVRRHCCACSGVGSAARCGRCDGVTMTSSARRRVSKIEGGALKYLSSSPLPVVSAVAVPRQACVECPWLPCGARRCGRGRPGGGSARVCATSLWAHVSAWCPGGDAWYMCRWVKFVSFRRVSTAENRRVFAEKPFVLFSRRLEMTPLFVRVSRLKSTLFYTFFCVCFPLSNSRFRNSKVFCTLLVLFSARGRRW